MATAEVETGEVSTGVVTEQLYKSAARLMLQEAASPLAAEVVGA